MPFEAIHMQRFSHSESAMEKREVKDLGAGAACFEIPTEAHALLCVRGILDKNAAHKKVNEQIAKQQPPPSAEHFCTAGAHTTHREKRSTLFLFSLARQL